MNRIKIWKDPYCEGFNTCTAGSISIQEGVTVVVGCNGAGKSTLIHNISEQLKEEHITVLMYNNLHDGGSYSFGALLFDGDYSGAASMWASSEGEQIRQNICNIAKQVHRYLKTGNTEKSDRELTWEKLFKTESEVQKDRVDERWILLDAVDSGYSVDNVIDLKNLFNMITKDAKQLGVNLYIVITANEYELANGQQCLDVHTGKYITFKDYEEYRSYIIKSRKKVDARYERLRQKNEKSDNA